MRICFNDSKNMIKLSERKDEKSWFDYWFDGQYLDAKLLSVIYCSTCKDSDWFQWIFTEMPDYKLNAIMTEFQYELPLQVISNSTLILLYLYFQT